MKPIIITLAILAITCQISCETSPKSSCLAHKDFAQFTHCISKRETSKCYDGGCITCLRGRCMQTCVGETCKSCPTGSCCDGKNCNICIDGTCCKGHECNSCIHECKESCLTSGCRETCTASCISAHKQTENENTLNDENVDYKDNDEEEDALDYSTETESSVIANSKPCAQSCTGSCSEGKVPCSNTDCGKKPCSSSTPCSSSCGSSCSTSSCNSPCASSCQSPCSSSCGSSCSNSGCSSGCSGKTQGCTNTSRCNQGCSNSKMIEVLKPTCNSGCNNVRSRRY